MSKRMIKVLFSALAGLYRDWRLRRAGAKEARLSALEAGQARAKRLAEITAYLDTLDDDERDLRLRQYQRAIGWVQPTIVAEEDKLTTAA